jgi:hypothetical protein
MSVKFGKDPESIEEYTVTVLSTLAILAVPVLVLIASF